MNSLLRIFAITLSLLTIANQLQAQWDVNGPNAVLRLQGQVPSAIDSLNHDIDVPLPGDFELEIQSGSNPNMPFILLGSPIQPGPSQGLTPLAWGGSIDVGLAGANPGTITQVTVVWNGINPSTIFDYMAKTDAGSLGVPPRFESRFPLGKNLDGFRYSLQTIVMDPTNPGFPFDNTEAVDANCTTDQRFIVETDDDGVVEVEFPCFSFEFHGVSYTSMFVAGNGFITFGGPTTITGAGFSRDNVGWVNAEPSISACLADWDPGTIASPAFADGNQGVYFETNGNLATLTWGHPDAGGMVGHFAGADKNQFSIDLTLNDGVDPAQGNFSVCWDVLDQNTLADYGSGLVGHSPGGAAIIGGVFDRDLNNIDGAGDISGSNEAQLEEHDFAANAQTLIGGDGNGLRRTYNNFTRNKNGRCIDFIAITAIVGGDLGYLALGQGTQPDDVSEFCTTGPISTSGGEILVLGGVFFGFDITTGSVTFDPAGLAIPAAVLGICDDTGTAAGAIPNSMPAKKRNGQALEVLTLPMPGLSGLVDVEIDFGNSGIVKTIQVMVQ